MMGRQVGEAQLFYIFSVDRHVPADHLLRRVDAVLDLSFIRRKPLRNRPVLVFRLF